MKKYDVWTTKDGRQIPVGEMTDTHLVHTIRAIEEGRLFPSAQQEECTDSWLTVLKGEALKRGLDFTQPATKRVSLIDWLCQKTSYGACWGDTLRSMRSALRQHGIAEPEIDVSNLDGAPTYLHWQTGPGVGTPLEGK